MAAIDIGPTCINRPTSASANITVVAKDNPANAAGAITKVWIWPVNNMTGVEVATFYETNGNTLSTRDTESIPGTITAGAAREYAVNLDVKVGDYIGIHWTGGDLEWSVSGFAGAWYLDGDYIPCTDEVFALQSGDAFSLYGEGEIPSAYTAQVIMVQCSALKKKIYRRFGNLWLPQLKKLWLPTPRVGVPKRIIA